MKRKIIGKNQIMLLTALIFVLVPVIRPGQPVKAAGDGTAAVVSGSIENATDDWNVMTQRLDEAIRSGTGQNVGFLVGNHFEIPTDILGRLAGKNATLALHTSNGVTFSISGGEVYAADAPFTVDVSFESVIPDEVKQQLPGNNTLRQFSMVQKDAYPCILNVHLALGEEYAGKHAVLYSYDEAGGRMRQEGIFRINGQGNAMFGLRRGDEYLVAVYRGYAVAEGDTLSHVAVRNHISLQNLLALNPQIQDADRIQIGQMVNLPN